jgi:hypothetical protein
MSTIPDAVGRSASSSSSTRKIDTVTLGPNCLANAPAACVVGFVRVNDTPITAESSTDRQIRVLAMYQRMLERATCIAANLPMVVVVDACFSHDFVSHEQHCSRILSREAAKPGRVVLLATPDRLSIIWAHLKGFLYDCLQHNVPVFSSIPTIDSTSDIVEPAVYRLDPRVSLIMNPLQGYLDVEIKMKMYVNERLRSMSTPVRGTKKDLEKMLKSRGITDGSKVMGVARVEGQLDPKNAAKLKEHHEWLTSFLPDGITCFAFHQDISAPLAASELDWAMHVRNKRAVVCVRLDAVLGHLSTMRNLIHRYPELWLIVISGTEKARPSAGESSSSSQAEPFLAFQLKDIIAPIPKNGNPFPLQEWVCTQLEWCQGFRLSNMHGSQAMLDVLYAAAAADDAAAQ